MAMSSKSPKRAGCIIFTLGRLPEGSDIRTVFRRMSRSSRFGSFWKVPPGCSCLARIGLGHSSLEGALLRSLLANQVFGNRNPWSHFMRSPVYANWRTF